MKKLHTLILILLAAALMLGLWTGFHSTLSWRFAVLKMKLAGRLDGLGWPEIIVDMKDYPAMALK